MSEVNVKLANKFNKERDDWTAKTKDFAKMLRRIENVAQLQVDIYSSRQDAVEYYHYLRSVLITLNKKYKEEKVKKIENFNETYEYKVTPKQLELLVSNSLSERVEQIELFENHISFMNNTIETINNIIYGIKYRIDLENIKRQL